MKLNEWGLTDAEQDAMRDLYREKAMRLGQYYDDEGIAAVYLAGRASASTEAINELIAADAARYRWLRAKHNAGDEHAFVYGAKDDLDEYIDAEMKRS